MNTHRVLHSPMIGSVVVVLVLLVTLGLAALIPLTWSLISASPPTSPIQTDPLEMVNAFHSAINSDNVDAMLTLFADDATVVDNGLAIEGKEEIQNWVLYSHRMVGLRLKMLHSQVAGEKVFWYDMARNEPEAQQRVYLLRWMAVIQNGKIQSLTVSLRPMPDGK